MDIEDYSNETIDYIYGDLNEQEKASFEEKLKSDPVLAEEVSKLKEMMGEIKLGVQLEDYLNDPGNLLSNLQSDTEVQLPVGIGTPGDYNKHKQREYLLSKQFRNKYVYPIAASIAAILYFGNLAFFIASPELAFKKYYKEYEPIYYAQATINEAQALYVHSFDAYTKGDYEAVAENMHTLMEEGNLNVRGQIMLAFYDAWTKEFIKKEDPNQMFKEDATWALAITAYKLGELEQAQELFHEIATEKYKRAGKAARMERKVSEMLMKE
jgi:hypothetical protein